jgi:hypothetical protein
MLCYVHSLRSQIYCCKVDHTTDDILQTVQNVCPCISAPSLKNIKCYSDPYTVTLCTYFLCYYDIDKCDKVQFRLNVKEGIISDKYQNQIPVTVYNFIKAR